MSQYVRTPVPTGCCGFGATTDSGGLKNLAILGVMAGVLMFVSSRKHRSRR